jgi:hypothetical protein
MNEALEQDVLPTASELVAKSNVRRERLCIFLCQMGLKAKEQSVLGAIRNY